MQIREKTAEVKFHAFDFYVRVVFSSNPVESRRRRNKILGRLPEDTVANALHCWKEDQAVSYLFLPGKGLEAGTIAHECWHAVRRMLHFCGAELDNETVAYHLGYLVTQVHKAAKR